VLEQGARVAVVGHVEWVQFARVETVPHAGGVVHASDPFEEPAGGGAVAAVQLARLAGQALLITALGDDEHGRSARRRLAELGVEVRAALVGAPTRRALTLLDDDGERTIVTLGERLDPPAELVQSACEAHGDFDGVYFTAGDAQALREVRACTRVVTASPRAEHALGQGVELDALILSASDELELERARAAAAEADALVMTEGAGGGSFRRRGGGEGRWRGVPPPGPIVDNYGCGDSFAGGLTFALARGLELADALELAARCGAACASGRGPYGRQLRGEDL
jgi:ribokinase